MRAGAAVPVVALAGWLGAPAGAAAQAPAQLSLRAEQVAREGPAAVALRGDAFRIRGRLDPAAPGQVVVLRIHRNGKRTATRRVDVAPDGSFSARMPAKRAGRVSIRAIHPRSPELDTVEAPPLIVLVARPRLGAGRRGPLVRLVQRGLANLRYAAAPSGVFDAGTARAVMAFRKVNGLGRSYRADAGVIRRVLRGEGAFRPRDRGAGRHAEADLSRQVLALVEAGRVTRVHHMSSGAVATPTPTGAFRVYLKTPGVNAKGMVHSSYFIRGYAIHGYASVPAFNASHGCLRVPVPDARGIFDWLRVGDRVLVYR